MTPPLRLPPVPVPPGAKETESSALAPHEHPPPPVREKQLSTGAETRALVTVSSASNHASVDASSFTVPLMGRTHENSLGLPAYLIWSQSTVRVPEVANAMRCPVTTVAIVP